MRGLSRSAGRPPLTREELADEMVAALAYVENAIPSLAWRLIAKGYGRIAKACELLEKMPGGIPVNVVAQFDATLHRLADSSKKSREADSATGASSPRGNRPRPPIFVPPTRRDDDEPYEPDCPIYGPPVDRRGLR